MASAGQAGCSPAGSGGKPDLQRPLFLGCLMRLHGEAHNNHVSPACPSLHSRKGPWAWTTSEGRRASLGSLVFLSLRRGRRNRQARSWKRWKGRRRTRPAVRHGRAGELQWREHPLRGGAVRPGPRGHEPLLAHHFAAVFSGSLACTRKSKSWPCRFRSSVMSMGTICTPAAIFAGSAVNLTLKL